MIANGPCKVAVYPRLEEIPDYSNPLCKLQPLLTEYKNIMEEKNYRLALDVIGEMFSIAGELVSITAKQLLKSHIGGVHEYESAKGKVQPTQKEIHARLTERLYQASKDFKPGDGR